jgi:hypothetical protein
MPDNSISCGFDERSSMKKVIDASGRIVRMSLTSDAANADTPMLPVVKEAPMIHTLNMTKSLFPFDAFNERLWFA